MRATYILPPFRGKVLVVYFDDIIIYSPSGEENLKYLLLGFNLQAEKLYINLAKCSFLQFEVVFLGFVVLAKGIYANFEKVKAILD